MLYVTGGSGQRMPWRAQLMTITGQLVLDQQAYDEDFSMNIGGCQPGVYVLRLFNGGGVQVLVQKVLVE
jgi:hypothetical protein